MIPAPDRQAHARLIKHRERGLVERLITHAPIEALKEVIRHGFAQDRDNPFSGKPATLRVLVLKPGQNKLQPGSDLGGKVTRGQVDGPKRRIGRSAHLSCCQLHRQCSEALQSHSNLLVTAAHDLSIFPDKRFYFKITKIRQS